MHRLLIYKFITEQKPEKLKMALEDSTEGAALRQNPSGFSPTTFAIKEGAVDCLEVLYQSGVCMETQNDITQLTPIQASWKYKSGKCFLKLCQLGVRIPDMTVAVAGNGNLFNVRCKHVDRLSMQVEDLNLEGLDNLLKKEGVTQVVASPLQEAIEQDDVSHLEELLQAGLNPNIEDSKGLLPLYALKSDSDLRSLDMLLENGAKPHRWWEDWHGLRIGTA